MTIAEESQAESGAARGGPRRAVDRGLLAALAAAAGTASPLALDHLDESELHWAVETGLGPLLRRLTPEASPLTRSANWPLVLGSDLSARMECASRLEATEEILAACPGRLPPPVLLKGISLCDSVYPEPHLRPMRDVDLLVEPEHVRDLETLVAGLGYEQARARGAGPGHHGPPFVHPQHGVWVEVHHRLFPPESELGCDSVFGPGTVRAESRASAFRGQPAARLSAELQLVHLAAHWGSSFKLLAGPGGLLPMLDVIYLLRTTALRWPTVLDWLDGAAASGHVYLLLAYLDRNGLVGLPAGVLEGLRRRQRALGRAAARAAFRLIDRYMVRGRPVASQFHERALHALWTALLLRGTPARKLTTAGRLLARG